MKKADQLARLCHADVALIIRRNGRYYDYTIHEVPHNSKVEEPSNERSDSVETSEGT